MNVLIACEESQRVCIAFREKGYDAYSCDVQECSGGHPEWHILGDALEIINPRYITKNGERCAFLTFATMDGKYHAMPGKWDLIIAHPPCTYLSNAGACRLYPTANHIDKKRYKKGLKAKEFFLKCLNADCKYIAVENPIASAIYQLPQYTQIIQPYEYGHPYTKKTCLWLKNLPTLTPTNVVKPVGGWVCGNSEIWKKQAAKGQVIGKEKSAKHRSKTFKGIAEAMAQQWGKFVEQGKEMPEQLTFWEV